MLTEKLESFSEAGRPTDTQLPQVIDGSRTDRPTDRPTNLVVKPEVPAVDGCGVLEAQASDVGEAEAPHPDVVVVVDVNLGHSGVVPAVVERHSRGRVHRRERPGRRLLIETVQ